MSMKILGYEVLINQTDFNTGITTQVLRVDVECDTVSDLPPMNYTTLSDNPNGTVTFAMGSTAHIIADNTKYVLKSNGTWVLQPPESVSYTYTKTEIDAMLTDLSNQLDGVDESVVMLIDDSGKNRLNLTAQTQTVDTVTLTLNDDGTYHVESTSPTTQQVVFTLGESLLHAGVQYIITGITNGSNTTFFLNYDKSSSTGTGNTNIYAGGYSIAIGDVERTTTVKLYIRAGQEINIDIAPMICEKRWWDVNKGFCKYVPTLYDLWQMVRGYHP